MKLLTKFALLMILLSTVFGCATTENKKETLLQPPAESFNPVFLGYKEKPGEKVLVVAVDPGGRWAFGYDHSQVSIEEAAKNAAIKCDSAREEHKVFTKAKIFAINDKVVYEGF